MSAFGKVFGRVFGRVFGSVVTEEEALPTQPPAIVVAAEKTAKGRRFVGRSRYAGDSLKSRPLRP